MTAQGLANPAVLSVLCRSGDARRAVRFDSMGNRLTKTEGGTTETYGYNAANMLVSRNGQAYVNDANGNTLSGGGRTNTWDSQNRLVQCVSGGNTSQFVYGADGLRRTSIVNGNPVHYALDSGMMVRELRAEGQELRASATYLLGPRGPEYRRDDQTQAIRWYLYDGLGSVLGEVDPSGNLTASRKYDVYGLVRAGDNGTSRHKFVGSLGHTSEDETGLIYMRARWMDPALGRFISEDPARDGANWFEYCRGNPVNAVDRTGKFVGAVVGGVFGFVFALISGYYSGLTGAQLLMYAVALGLGGAVGGLIANPAVSGFVSGFLGSVLGDWASGGLASVDLKKALVCGAVAGGLGGFSGWVLNKLGGGFARQAELIGDDVADGLEGADAIFGACVGSIVDGTVNFALQ